MPYGYKGDQKLLFQVKQCSRCFETKPLEQFSPDKRYAAGVTGWCIQCRRQHGREYGERQLRSRRPIQDYKTCTLCKQRKESSEFALCPSKKSGLSSRCKECRRIVENAQRKPRALERRESVLKIKYGLTFAKVEEMRAAQNNCCALCNVTLEGGTPQIDHCHDSGRVRGILCAKCNRWMAAVDKPGWLDKALAYKARTS